MYFEKSRFVTMDARLEWNVNIRFHINLWQGVLGQQKHSGENLVLAT